MDLLGILLIAAGCLMVYGSSFIVRLFNQEHKDRNVLIIKSIGLMVGVAGCMRILDIF